MIEQIAVWLVDLVEWLGYPGIFIAAFLESTFMPIPSEATMIPAGYLVYRGVMGFWPVFILSTLGAIGGALFNYVIAYHLGRRFMLAYGKYMFFDHDKMEKLDKFFVSHGEISMLTGRLIPGVRHVISFPAGLAHMNLKKFCLYTGIGSAIWMLTLIFVGYQIGGNQELVRKWTPYVVGTAVGVAALLVVSYVIHHRRKHKKEEVDDLAA